MEVEDYPRTLAELEARFSSEGACRDYLFQLRWPDGFRCPRCGIDKAWPLRSGRMQCCGCGQQVSVTAGTPVHLLRPYSEPGFQICGVVSTA